MVATQQLLDALKQIGLNLYERKLWTALLSRGTSTAGELSSLAKVPHSRTYDVLESLAEKGFVMVQTTKPLKYVAIPPMEALDRAKKKLAEDTDISINRITQIQGSGTVKELEKIFKNGMSLVEPGELTGSMRGRHMLHQQMGTLFKGAKKSISIMTTADGFADLHAKHADVLKKAASKGVKVRIAAPMTKDTVAAANAFKEFADVKKLDKNGNGRFALVDGNHMVLALTDDRSVDPTQDLALWTQSEHVAAEVFGPMFESVWKGLANA